MKDHSFCIFMVIASIFSYLTCSFQLKKKRHAHFELPKAISHFSPIFKVYHTILWAPYFNKIFGAARQTPCSPLLRVGTHSNVFYIDADVVLFLTQQNIGNWFGLVCVSWIRWYLLVRRFFICASVSVSVFGFGSSPCTKICWMWIQFVVFLSG